MPGRKHPSWPAQRGDWLCRDESRRERPWALAEQLFEPAPAQLDAEPSTLDRLERQVRDQARRIAELETKLAQLPAGEQEQPREQPAAPVRTVALRRQNGPDREFWLAHCEGFLVESPDGAVGVVETVLFGSRLDLPDEIEIRTGRFRQLELVVSIEEIDEVDPDRERITLAYDPRIARRQFRSSTLLPRALRRLDSFVSTRRQPASR